MRVTAGRAVMFLRNFNLDFGFDPDEVCGVGVSDGFRGAVSTDVRGHIATVLDAGDTLTLGGLTANIQFASIAGLTVAGRVTGDVLAANRICNLTIGSGLFLTTAGPSAGRIATGSGTDGTAVALGPENYTADFTQPAGQPRGGITNVWLAAGGVRGQRGRRPVRRRVQRG